MSRLSVVLGFTVAVGGAMSCGAGERERWTPGPSALQIGAIDGGYLLSYQWEPTDAPPRSRIPHPSTAKWLVPAERWLVALEWDPKDIHWYLCDLAEERVSPVKDVTPLEAKALSIYRNGMAPHRAPHRWRWTLGHLWITKFDRSGSFTPGWFAGLLRMSFDPRRPATIQTGTVTWPPPWSEDGPFSSDKYVAFQGTGRNGPLDGQVVAYRSHSAAIRGRLGMSLIKELVYHGMPWWDDWVPADGYRQNRIDYDCVPISDNEATLAVLVENGMSVWEGDRRRMRRPDGVNKVRDDFQPSIGGWRRVATFASPFIEPFHLTLGDDGYFFVTDESGEVHRAQQQEGEWTTVPLWNDPARPVLAMLTNSNDSTTYVFGKDFYFQLARQIEVKPCKDITQGRRDLTDPMRTVVECAQILQEADLLGDYTPALLRPHQPEAQERQ